MRILLAHNKYQQPGGEDIAFEREATLLAASGHQVSKFVVDNNAIDGIASKAETFMNVLNNRRIVEEFDGQISAFQPEIVHFHNFFPRLSPGAISRAVRRNIPTLQTLHNYRHICANGLFLRRGAICVNCLGRPMRIPALVHGCYRQSPLGTLAVTRAGRRFRQLFDAFPRHLMLVALTNFAREKMIHDGYSSDRVLVKPNSVSDAGVGAEPRERRVLFVGRLSIEKGADFLIQLAKSIDVTFELIGDGPEMQRLQAAAPRNVIFSGWLDHHLVRERIKTAAAVVVPSRSFEGFGMIVVEAFSAATPVVASRIGSLGEIVEDGTSGLTRPVDDHRSWIDAIQLLLSDHRLARSLGHGGRLAFENKYTSQNDIRRLMEIYAHAVDRATKSTT